ncbi:MAG TPA: hypothetical protein H9808_06540 [Candidatus Atopostipes pullistercoris]|uniref:DAGKc domain-containing protein n=1 Tax=Candidatus Atopostipes pullistercoris TaxID=2838467 RepID=A0A9D2JXY1_9LACT|nr:hypothetical protein [Candidatus Atopostipes pullistercoris]
MDRFLHLIVNKQSRKSESTFKKLLIELPKHTQNYKIYVTETTDKLDDVVKDLKISIKKSDLVIVIGGDGSLNHLVSLFEKYHLSNYIGYIPSGSGNDFARSHNMPLNTEKAIAHIFNLKAPKEVSILKATQGDMAHYAVNSIGIGIDGNIIHKTNESQRKKFLGGTSYLSHVVSAFIKQEKFPITIKVDDGIYSFDNVQFALIANNPYFGGGIKIIPVADGTDDIFEILVADDISPRHLLVILRKLLIHKNHLTHPNLHHFKTKEAALYAETKQYAQKDGESFEQDGFAYTITTLKRKFWI